MFLVLATAVHAQTVVNYYSVPTPAATPAEITAGQDGALWFTEYHGQKIGRITTSGVITEYPLPSYFLPWGITAGPDGALWYASYGNALIGRITTAGVVTQYTLSSRATGGIAVGPDGALWFSEGPKIGRITVGGVITEYALPADFPDAWGITAGPDGAMWFTGGIYFSVGAKIGRITTAGVVTVYPVPTLSCGPVGITVGPDRTLWFTTYGDYSCPVVRYNTDGTINRFGSGAGFKITAGPDGALWFTGYGYKIGRLTVDGTFEVVVERDDPNSAYYGIGIAVGPDRNLWFTEPDTNRIGQVVLPNPTLPVTTTTLVSSLNPSFAGQTVTFKATVNSIAGVPPDGEPISFKNGAAVWGTAPLRGGTASLTTSALLAGTFTITARYAGDPNFGGSTSPGLRQVVNYPSKSMTSTALVSSLNPSIYGQAVSWAAMVTTSGSVPPTGTVAFRWSNSGRIFTIGRATLNAGGVATLTRSNLNADPFGIPYPIIAVYSGDASNLGTASAVLSQHVLQTKTAASITSSTNPSTQGQAVTFTAKITSPTVVVTGPVTFSVGSSILGTAQLAGGIAKFTTSALPVGSSTVKVTYSGDSNVAKSSSSLVQTVR
jgi:streptogramin lyase